MSRIRSTNTGIDLNMKKILSTLNCKFQMYPKMYGNPDFLIGNKGIAIFCDGDFWHGYKYQRGETLTKFWREKIESNIRRDHTVSRKLRNHGLSVLRFWEHDIEKRPDMCRRKIQRKIREKKFK